MSKNLDTIEYDTPTYPEFGIIYEGDYYSDLPFENYINEAVTLPFGENVFDIRKFGAVPEENRLNTEAFQRTVEACKNAGGGTILVQGGRYCMGTVYLYDNMTLFIAPDAALVASKDCSRFAGAFVIANGANNLTITGGGRIYGNGEWFVYEPKKKPLLTPLFHSYLPPRNAADINGVEGTMRYYYRQRIRYAEDKYGEGLPDIKRPRYMVWLKDCNNVRIENVILEDAMCWTLNLDCNDGVEVKDLVINNNRHVANTDGIDITGSSNVSICHCFISTADDGIVVKNPIHTKRVMKNIHVKDCTVLSVMNDFKIGTETRHPISDILVENCIFRFPDIYPGTVSGISIESADGSQVSNVTIRNISMSQVTCPLFIALNMRNRYDEPYSDEESSPYWGGSIENIRIEHITAVEAEAPSILSGFINQRKDGSIIRKAIRNVAISDFHVTYRDNEEIVNVPEVIEEYLYEYPENNNFGDVDACGIWMRHCDNVGLEKIKIVPRTGNEREAMKKIDVKEI